MSESDSYLQAAYAYADGVRVLFAPSGVPTGERGERGPDSYRDLVSKAEALAPRSDQLTAVTANQLSDEQPERRVEASIQLLAKTLTDLDVSQYLFQAAVDQEDGIGWREDAGGERSSVSLAYQAQLDLLLRQEIELGAERGDRQPQDLATARSELKALIEDTLDLILERSSKTLQGSLTGLAGVGLADVGQAAGAVGLELAKLAGQAEAVKGLYGWMREFALKAYNSLLALVGPRLAESLGKKVLDWFHEFQEGKQTGQILDRLYQTQGTAADLGRLVDGSQSELDKFVAAIQGVGLLEDGYYQQMRLVDMAIPRLKYLRLIPVTAQPVGQLIMAAIYIVLGGYVVLAGADYVDARLLQKLDRVPGVRRMVEGQLLGESGGKGGAPESESEAPPGAEQPKEPPEAKQPEAPPEAEEPKAPPEAEQAQAPPEAGPSGGLSCPECGQPMMPDWKICAFCGAELKTGPKLCAVCGAEIVAGARFCHKCGAAVGQNDAVEEPAEHPEPLPPERREGMNMAIKEYRELVLFAREAEKDESGLRKLTAQVLSTPGVGEGAEEVVELPPELAQDLSMHLYRLEHRRLKTVEEIIALGETLADLLLPSKSRSFFTRSLDKLERGQGLRVRLRLHPLLADIPWEYMYIQRGDGGKDETGFLALDPRVSLVRHEALGIPADLDTTPRSRRLVAAMACPEQPGYDALDLAQELANQEEALSGLPNVQLVPVQNATIQALSDALGGGADIFHFAGHGRFQKTGEGESFRSIVGEGELAFVTETGAADPIPAAQLAVNLQGHGVQLALLGACQTGRRDGQNVWSGTVAALMEAGIPAAVAMQYKIWDDAAIAFSRSFYQALATGAPLDAAVSAGRIAAFNVGHRWHEDPERSKYWRDWGVPVLYLRSEQAVVLPAVEDEAEREALAGALQVVVNDRIDVIGSKGKYRGVEAGVMEAGTIDAYLKSLVIEGKVTLVDVEETTGGIIRSRADVKRLDGELTNVRLGRLGTSSMPVTEPAVGPKEAEGVSTCPECGEPVQDDWSMCPFCGADLKPKTECPSCSKEVQPEWVRCPFCGADLKPSTECRSCGKEVQPEWVKCPFCGVDLRD